MDTKRMQRFESREEAGRKLAKRLDRYSKPGSVIVLALPKGGVPIGAEIAKLLNKPFDVRRILADKCLIAGTGN